MAALAVVAVFESCMLNDASAKWNVVCVGLHPPEDSEGNEEGKGRESEAVYPYQAPF